MRRIYIGSPEVPKVIEPGVDQHEYRHFLLEVRDAARLALSKEPNVGQLQQVEGEVVDDKKE